MRRFKFYVDAKKVDSETWVTYKLATYKLTGFTLCIDCDKCVLVNLCSKYIFRCKNK